jgi:hypothetical protein
MDPVDTLAVLHGRSLEDVLARAADGVKLLDMIREAAAGTGAPIVWVSPFGTVRLSVE